MKMKKFLGIVLALMLVLSMVPTALAEPDNAVADPDGKAWLSKTYNSEAGHEFDFKFSATQDTTTAGYIHDLVSCTIPDISFTDKETGSTTKRVQLSFGDFTKAGIYRYTVTETGVAGGWTDTDHEKLSMSKAKYEVRVYVEQYKDNGVEINVNDNWDNVHNMGIEDAGSEEEPGVGRAASNKASDYKVVKIVVESLLDDDGNTKKGKVDSSDSDKNTFKFVNTHVFEGGWGPEDPDYPNKGSLYVSKTLSKDGKAPEAGSDAAKKEFTFTATFGFPEDTDQKTLGGVTAGGESITLPATNEYTFKLKHDGHMVFKGLPVGTTVTIKEDGTPNYMASALVSMNEKNPADSVTAGYSEDLIVNSEDLAVDNQKLGKKTNTIDVTNTYITTPPTGVILNILPYALMMAIAGGMMSLFIALKRRKAQYEEE